MLGLKQLSIDLLTHTPWLVALAVILLGGLTVLLYYKTNPMIESWKRWTLAALRALAVLALILALVEPVISYEREWQRPPRYTVVLDHSASMDHLEAGKSRQARLDSLLSSPQFEQLRSASDIHFAYFGDGLSDTPDKVGREKTALGNAIASLATAEMTAPADQWIVLSDGKSNAGRSVTSVAATLATPITTVNLAVDIGDFDFALEEVDYNPVLFVGQSTEIKVSFSWHQAVGKTARVQLLDQNKVIAENSLQVTQEDGQGEVSLRFTPTEPGQRLLRVTLPPMQGESQDGNNSRTISVKVLKSRLMVLVVTDRPDHEVGFLRRYLTRADKYDVDLRVTGPRAGNLAGRFPAQQTELNRYDLIILHDPDPQMLTPYQSVIHSYLADRGGAIWVLLGEQFASRGPVPWFNELLPFTQTSRRKIEWTDFHGQPAEDNLFHPSIRIADERTAIREAWNDLPPFKSLVRTDQTDPHATILAYVAESGRGDLRTPILGFKRFGPGKLLASAALPYWTWGFVQLGFGGNDSSYARFVEGTTRWLTVRDDFDPVRILPEKEIFTRGEPVRFQGFAFDQGYRPIPGAVGTVTLTSKDKGQTFDADLLDKGEGKYEANFDQLSPGTYSYVGRMNRDGTELKRNEGSIVVETFSLEEFDQAGDPSTLQVMAATTGGKYYTFRDFDKAITGLTRNPIAERIHSEIPLWGKTWLLFVFIGLLSIEWVLRKLNQLL